MAGQCAFHCIVTVLVSHLLFCSGISQLDFTTEPHDVVALPGEPLLLECEVTGENPIDITWRQDGVEIVPGSRRHILSNGSLQLEEVAGTWNSSEDRGRYQCCAENSIGIVCSRRVDVSIARLARPEVSLTNTAPVIINGTARLVCDVEADPTPRVTWTKDGEPLQIDGGRVTALQSGVLQIIPVEATDAGSYSCSTLNLIGKKTSHHFQLDIATLASLPQPLPHAPLIMAGPQNATLMSGSACLLECAISSVSLQVEWSRKDGKQIPQDRSEIVGYSNLMLTGLRVSDSGVYICTATNPESSSAVQQSESTLHVIDPPVFTTIPENLGIRDGAKARFHCQAEGTPTPQLTWAHNGKVLNDKDGRTSHMKNNDLVIWNVREQDSGIYQCFASNEGGEVQAGALLEVKLPVNRPDPPHNLTALPLSSQSILIGWVPPNQTIMAYTLHFYKSLGGQEELEPIIGTLGSYIVTNLQPYTNYTFYMRSYADAAPSLLSQRISAMTSEGVPSCGPHFWLISSTEHSIEVHWQEVEPACRNGIILKYRYCYRQTGHKDYVCREVRDADRKMATIWGLKPATTYSVAMSAATVMGFGTDTSWVFIRTVPVSPSCQVPPAFTLEWSVVNSSFVQLTWSDPDPLPEQPANFTMEGFRLIMTSEADGLSETLLLGPSERAYAFSDLDPGTTYDVVLYGFNHCGSGQEWVETISTLPDDENPGDDHPSEWPATAPPNDLRATEPSSSSINLVWSPPSGDIQPDYYLVTYRPFDLRQEKPEVVYSSTCQVHVKGLKPFTVYQFTVQAVVDGVNGQPGAVVYFKTLGDEPSAPVNVGANPIDPHRVAVTWEPPIHKNGIIATYIILYIQDITQPESVWNKTEKSGNIYTNVVEDLISNTKYYFRVCASNQVGQGPPSKAVAAVTPRPSDNKPGNRNKGRDPSMEKGILASIVLVTSLILACTIAVVCRERIRKRNRRQAEIAARRGGSRHGYPYGNGNPATGAQTNGDMDMEMSPMLHSNGYHVSLQGNGTPGRRLCNSNSNHSPYFVRGNSQQGSQNPTNHQHHDHHHHHHHLPSGMDHGDNQSEEPECQVVMHQQQNPSNIHQHSIIQDRTADSHSSNTSYSETQYLPGHHFNSGQCSPQVSGQSSPQIHTDQEEESVLSSEQVGRQQQEQQQQQRDELGLHLPYTLSSLATTSGTGAPSGSHDSHIPPETNRREVGSGLDIWGVDDPHRPQSCGSTGGDSGMIDDMEWETHDTSPDFVQKALLQVSGDASLYTV